MAPRTPSCRARRSLAWPLVVLLPLACNASSNSDPNPPEGPGTHGGDSDGEGSSGDRDDAVTSGDATSDHDSGSASTSGVGPGSGSDGELDAGPDSGSSTGSGTDTGTGSESGAACRDVENDPQNCGACGEVCGAPSHGEPVCESSMCAVECDSGYDGVDLDGATRCSKFAGFFLLRETGTCEAINPFTGDCTCPSGFDDRPVSSWRIDPNDGSSFVQLAVCSPIAGDPTDSWGGMFAQYEDTGSCAFPNPLNVPLCLCPDGYSVTSQWRGANINGDAIEISFCTAGAFESDALFAGGFTEMAGGGCATADCNCPAGTTQVDYPTVFAGSTTTSSFCYQP